MLSLAKFSGSLHSQRKTDICEGKVEVFQNCMSMIDLDQENQTDCMHGAELSADFFMTQENISGVNRLKILV